MTKPKIVYCPSCYKKIFPDWSNATGVFRGWCSHCKSVVYVRVDGRPWLSRPRGKRLTILDSTPPVANYVRLHHFLTQTDLVTIRDLIRDVWDDLKGLFTGSCIVTTGGADLPHDHNVRSDDGGRHDRASSLVAIGSGRKEKIK